MFVIAQSARSGEPGPLAPLMLATSGPNGSKSFKCDCWGTAFFITAAPYPDRLPSFLPVENAKGHSRRIPWAAEDSSTGSFTRYPVDMGQAGHQGHHEPGG